jgi:Domain of unknown function (DUF4304)
MPDRKDMLTALRTHLLPQLGQRGFTGSLPHLRRVSATGIDLLTVQFNRQGGSFVVEIARCAPSGFTTYWGKYIEPGKVTAHDLHPNDRHRLGTVIPGQDGRWFEFDGNVAVEDVAREVGRHIPEAEEWFSRAASRAE